MAGEYENGSTTDSDREHLVSPLRVRNKGDEVEFNIKQIAFREKLFFQDAQVLLKHNR